MKIVGDTVLASLPKIAERVEREERVATKRHKKHKKKNKCSRNRIKEDAMLKSPEILVPIDFSPCSVNALRVAVGMAAPEGDLTLLHVVDEDFVQAMRLLPGWERTEDLRARLKEQAEASFS